MDTAQTLKTPEANIIMARQSLLDVALCVTQKPESFIGQTKPLTENGLKCLGILLGPEKWGEKKV